MESALQQANLIFGPVAPVEQRLGGTRLSLRALNGKWLSSKNRPYLFLKDEPFRFTVFNLDRNDGFKHGDRVHIAVPEWGLYLKAEKGGAGWLHASSRLPRAWETFTLTKADDGDDATINSGDSVYISGCVSCGISKYGNDGKVWMSQAGWMPWKISFEENDERPSIWRWLYAANMQRGIYAKPSRRWGGIRFRLKSHRSGCNVALNGDRMKSAHHTPAADLVMFNIDRACGLVDDDAVHIASLDLDRYWTATDWGIECKASRPAAKEQFRIKVSNQRKEALIRDGYAVGFWTLSRWVSDREGNEGLRFGEHLRQWET
eukprot:Polyplicarium_translucidae@DN3388_c4_g1_i14.p1